MPRSLTTGDTVRELMEQLGRRAKGPGRVYLTGGATAVLIGWRQTTKDVDLKLLPEPEGIFEALRDVKEEMHINVELAAPDDFVPPVPGWQSRSIFISRHGQVDFFHYDPLSQAVAKIDRGHSQDLRDVDALVEAGLVRLEDIEGAFARIEGQLLRYPSIDAADLQQRLIAHVRAHRARRSEGKVGGSA